MSAAASDGSGDTGPAVPHSCSNASVRYDIVASGLLPVLDLHKTVKHTLFSSTQIRIINRGTFALRRVAFPLYIAGYALRCVVIFGPAPLGRALAPLALVFQLPVMAQVMLGFRVALLRLLVNTFDFAFLVLTATIWAICLGVYLHDARAMLVVQWFVDFLNLTLIETYLQDASNVVIGAAVAAAFQLALSAGVAFHLVHDAFTTTLNGAGQRAQHKRTISDALVNTMATMIMLLVRLAIRKRESMHKQQQQQQHESRSPWIQSISYRCRIALHEVACAPLQATTANALASAAPTSKCATDNNNSNNDATLSAAIDASRPASGSGPTTSSVTTVDRNDQRSQLRFVRVVATFEAHDTVVACGSAVVLGVARKLPQAFAVVHVATGVCGFVGLATAFALSDPPLKSTSSRTTDDVDVRAIVTVVSLSATLLFWLPVHCCLQRQLARRWLAKSFDVWFLSIQFLLSHVALCDMFAWRTGPCCNVLAGFVWIHSVLLIDALTPATRRQLGWPRNGAKWLITSVLAIHMAMQTLAVIDLLVQWNRHDANDDEGDDTTLLLTRLRIRNRLVLDRVLPIGTNVHLQFYVVPFFVSRQFTVFVWCVRLLHRLWTRQSDDELLLLLGNVEYSYDHRHQHARQAAATAVTPLPELLRTTVPPERETHATPMRFASERPKLAAVVPCSDPVK